MKGKRYARILLLTLVLSLLLSTTVFADMGPKPSVKIRIDGLGERPCIATLLSKQESTGPASAWEGELPEQPVHPTKSEQWNYDAFCAFAQYRDPDGFYFLQETFWVSEGDFTWGYYPPQTFKVLLYFPDTGELACGPVLERYAFRSEYRTSLEPDGSLGEFHRLTHRAEKLQAFGLRAGLTVLVELLLALAWGYRSGKAILLVLAVNLATQICLNLVLSLTVQTSGDGSIRYWLAFVFMELVVFLTEALIYRAKLPGLTPKRPKGGTAVCYALAANAASLVLGLWLEELLSI